MQTPPYIRELNRLHRQTVMAMLRARAAVDRINRDYAKLERGSSLAQVRWDPVAHDAFENESSSFSYEVLQHAKAVLSTAAAPLDITHEDLLRPIKEQERRIRDRHHSRGWDWMEPRIARLWVRCTPFRIWREIARQFDSEAMRDRAARAVAATLVQSFDLDRAAQLRIVAGRAELVCSVWSESRYGQSHPFLTHSSGEDIRRLIGALRVFAAQAFDEPPEAVHALCCQLERLLDRIPLVPRASVELAGGIKLVTFSRAIKLYWPMHLASALNLFVSTHAPETLSRRRAG